MSAKQAEVAGIQQELNMYQQLARDSAQLGYASSLQRVQVQFMIGKTS